MAPSVDLMHSFVILLVDPGRQKACHKQKSIYQENNVNILCVYCSVVAIEK